ncbi:hypothetical protein TWF481_010421 [Arthrobotrys musiformis]|uniref:Uncharacterized protein n=1 Tax=Arthrobotrys musiformis TaxID=47236 RepID=A0AAV9W335_9PEZI
MISLSDFVSVLPENSVYGDNWHIIAVATFVVAVLISCYQTYVNCQRRGPGDTQVYKPREESPTRGRNHISLRWGFLLRGTLDYPARFYLDFKDPDSLRKELRRYEMAGIVVLPTLHGMILGHGKLLLADDDIKTLDLHWPGAKTYFLAVYPEHAFRAMITIGSPLLEVLVNPGPTWANPIDAEDFEKMAWAIQRPFQALKAKVVRSIWPDRGTRYRK